jgi:hypothetical protein
MIVKDQIPLVRELGKRQGPRLRLLRGSSRSVRWNDGLAIWDKLLSEVSNFVSLNNKA